MYTFVETDLYRKKVIGHISHAIFQPRSDLGTKQFF